MTASRFSAVFRSALTPARTNLLRSTVLAFAISILLSAGAGAPILAQTPARAQPLDERQQLVVEKLRQEIENLKNERSLWRSLPAYAGVVTAIVALGGLAFTATRELRESRKLRKEELRQREADREEREKDRLEREEASVRRMEESFNTCVANLGSDSESLQASAAVALLTFLKPGYEAYREQVFLLVLAELKMIFPKLEGANPKVPEQANLASLNRLFVRVFERAAHRFVSDLSEDADRSLVLDFTRVNLDRINLSGLNLSGADIAFASLRGASLNSEDSILQRIKGREAHLEQARFSRADLTEARLQGAFCIETQFHKTRLVSADLQNAHLANAEFQQASMHGARLGGADLQGAHFQEAILDDARFNGATFDERALRTFLSGANWEDAHFDPPVREHLMQLAGKSSSKD